MYLRRKSILKLGRAKGIKNGALFNNRRPIIFHPVREPNLSDFDAISTIAKIYSSQKVNRTEGAKNNIPKNFPDSLAPSNHCSIKHERIKDDHPCEKRNKTKGRGRKPIRARIKSNNRRTRNNVDVRPSTLINSQLKLPSPI
jgi:hypothetical protein